MIWSVEYKQQKTIKKLKHLMEIQIHSNVEQLTKYYQ